MSRSASSASRTNEGGAGRRSRSKNPDSDAGSSAPNPDPAFFEAAFVIDDGDEPSRAGTPKPVPPEKDAPNGEPTQTEAAQKSNPGGDGKEGSSREGHAAGEGAAHATKPVLTLELKQKLRKLEKLEATYPGMWSLIFERRIFMKRGRETKELIAPCCRTFTILPGCASSCYCHRAFREGASREYTSGHYWRPRVFSRVSQPVEAQGKHDNGGT
jgi:hypothetical protein